MNFDLIWTCLLVLVVGWFNYWMGKRRGAIEERWEWQNRLAKKQQGEDNLRCDKGKSKYEPDTINKSHS